MGEGPVAGQKKSGVWTPLSSPYGEMVTLRSRAHSF